MSDRDMEHDEGPHPVILNIPLDWNDMQLSEQVKAVRFAIDHDRMLKGRAIVIIGPNPSNTKLNMAQVGSFADDLSNGSDTGLLTKSLNYYYNMLTSQLERARTPTHWWNVTCTNAGGTDLITTGATETFRILGGLITVTKDAACAGAQYISLLDGATAIIVFTISGAALVATGQVIIIPFTFPANGYKSILAGNNLAVNLNGAFTAGNAQVNVWGTIE